MTHSTKKRQSEEKETVKTANRIKCWVVKSIPMIFTVINIVMFAIILWKIEGLNKDNKQVSS